LAGRCSLLLHLVFGEIKDPSRSDRGGGIIG
jgi:hypothetical protein